MGKKLSPGFHTVSEKGLRFVQEDGTEIEVTKENINEFSTLDKVKFFVNQYPHLFGGVFDAMGRQAVNEVSNAFDSLSVLNEKIALLNEEVSRLESEKVTNVESLASLSDEDAGEFLELLNPTSKEDETKRVNDSPLVVQTREDLNDFKKVLFSVDLLFSKSLEKELALGFKNAQIEDLKAESEERQKKYEEELIKSKKLVAEIDENKEKDAKKSKKSKIIVSIVSGAAALFFLVSAGLGITLVKVSSEKNKIIDDQNKVIEEIRGDLENSDRKIAEILGVEYKDHDTMLDLLVNRSSEIVNMAKAFGWSEKITNEKGEQVKNPVSAYEFLTQQTDNISKFAEKLGYEKDNESMSSFIERIMNTQASDLLREIEDFKQNLKENGFEVEEGKTLVDLLNDVYEKNDKDVSDAVKNAHLQFAGLLSELGVSVSDVLDENGNLDKTKFDAKVSGVVEMAVNNIETIQNLETKFNAVLSALGNDKEVSDFDSIEDAFDAITDGYENKIAEVDQKIEDYLKKAFLDAKIKNGETYYAPSDFSSYEEATDFLFDYHESREDALEDRIETLEKEVESNKNLKTELENCKSELATVRAQNQEYYNTIEKLTQEKSDLEDQVDELEQKVEDYKNNETVLNNTIENLKKELETSGSMTNGNQGGVVGDEKEENISTPVADDEKDDQNNAGNNNTGSGRDNKDNPVAGNDEFQR